MYGSTMRSIWEVALETLTKTPLLIWRSRRSWRIFLGLGAMLLILRKSSSNQFPPLFPRNDAAHPLIRMTKKTLGWAGT